MIFRENYKRDFNNLLDVLNGKKTKEPVLFEFFMNDELYSYLSGEEVNDAMDRETKFKRVIKAFYNASYDYAFIPSWELNIIEFPKSTITTSQTRSLNEGFLITDAESFDKYRWPQPGKADYSMLNKLKDYLPENMKLMTCGVGGVLENAIDLVGFENLCMMTMLDEDLCGKIFDKIGGLMLEYYTICASFETIGGIVVNDDWGFKQQTMLSTDSMRKFVFPWHKKIVEAIHAAGKPAVLHSCGNPSEIMNDVIGYMKYNAKHSFEDNIIPIEMAIDRWIDEIPLMGGIDMDFLVREKPETIRERARNLLNKTSNIGKYTLGSGNSIPAYVPIKNYLAMIGAVEKT
jgi:uroporphyrinogen decarboxylase